MGYLRISSANLQELKVLCWLTLGQNSAPRNITFNGNHTADSTEYGDFQSAGDQTKGLSKNLKKEEIDLLDFDDMTKKK